MVGLAVNGATVLLTTLTKVKSKLFQSVSLVVVVVVVVVVMEVVSPLVGLGLLAVDTVDMVAKVAKVVKEAHSALAPAVTVAVEEGVIATVARQAQASRTQSVSKSEKAMLLHRPQQLQPQPLKLEASIFDIN